MQDYIRDDIRDDIKPYIYILNQVYEIEKKLKKLSQLSNSENDKNLNSPQRNIKNLKEYFQASLPNDINLTYHNPIGEDYNETRTDCDASIAGKKTENLKIVDVIKPIIRISYKGLNRIIQKAVVIVEASKD